MDFFQAQEAARKRTGLLVLLFGAAVVGIIAVVYAVVQIAIGTRPFDPLLLLQVAIGVSLVVVIGSASRTASLRRGGPAVAELLGGRRVAPDTNDLDERRLLNVVEEMALASGVPVPAVYVVDGEDAINAFAAGYTLDDAAVAVTRGALHAFTRDELQGVIAHEFSHILNGDMRLNIRLIGILYGILLLSVIGRGILHFGPRSRGRDRDNGGNGILLVAVALVIVGYIGVFFGRLIKAAVSRQREYLADSAAVEFTRDPSGLANALKKIAGAPNGSRIENHHAEELSHLFFANGLKSGIVGMLATHPPIEERIRRLDPSWPGAEAEPSEAPRGWERAEIAGVAGLATATTPTPATMLASIGAPTRAHLDHADELLATLPEPLRVAAHSADGAVALVFALIASTGDEEAVVRVADTARGTGLAGIAEWTTSLVPFVHEYGAGRRIALLELLLPSFGTTSPAESEALLETIDRAIDADGRMKIFEVTLRHVLARRLEGPRHGVPGGRPARSLRALHDETEIILSALAWAGGTSRSAVAASAFAVGAALLVDETGTLTLRDPSSLSVTLLDQSLSAFQHASLRPRRRFLEACAAAAVHDGLVQLDETEILVAISAALDCPMPPVLGIMGIMKDRGQTETPSGRE